MTEPPDDAGMATARTSLAWQRTALSLGAASAIIARLTWSTLGLLAVVTLAVALAFTCWVFVESRRRYRHSPTTPEAWRPRGGRAPLVLALSAALIAATELAALLAA